MAKVNVLNTAGKVVEEIELKDQVFGIEPSEASVHSVVVMQLANKRQGTHSTLTRAEVSGGGKKPWKQKGLPLPSALSGKCLQASGLDAPCALP